MKQGSASSNRAAGQKREPIAHAINEQAVAEIGIKEVRTVPNSLYAGRGFEAPKADCTIHSSGSQGKYR